MLGLLCVMALAWGGDPPPDKIQFKDGGSVEGVILRVEEDELFVAHGTRIRSYPLDDVDLLEGPRVAFPEYVERLRKTFEEPSAAACLELAEWCRQQGLLRDVDLQYWHTLTLDPENETAHTALGHFRRRGRWMVKVGNGGVIKWSDLAERRADFHDPWELTSAHFEVQAAGRLDEVVAACADLEQHYLAFFKTLQEPAGFYEVQAPIKVRLYPDRDSFPSQSSLLDAYFDRANRALYSYFIDGEGSRLTHEATHALLYYTARELGRKEPKLPGWIDEGLACYFEAALTGAPGARRFEPGRRDTERIEAHAHAEDPDGIVRVLNYDAGDFGASTGQARKYGQAYTLTYFLLHSSDPDRKEGFLRYIASVYQSQGSMSHFKNAMGVRDLDDLEEAWQDFVQRLAGA